MLVVNVFSLFIAFRIFLSNVDKKIKSNNNAAYKNRVVRNVLFIMNMRTCFSRRIGLIKSFTTRASSYLFLSLELFRGFFSVTNELA